MGEHVFVEMMSPHGKVVPCNILEILRIQYEYATGIPLSLQFFQPSDPRIVHLQCVKWQDAGENCIMKSSMVCTFHRILGR
jgi:hypothetical protein